MKTKKVTVAGKLVIFAIIVALIASVVYFTGGFNSLKDLTSGKTGKLSFKIGGSTSSTTKNDGVIDVSLDEWIGWKPIIDANGGLDTKPGSIYDKLGLKVKLHVIDDANQSSNALIKGDLDGAGYTVNRYAFLYPKFKNSDVNVVMPYITNSSAGGDGIISKTNINSVQDLVGKKIAVPRFSEAQTLVEWLMAKSELTDAQIKGIRSNMVMFDTPDDAAKAFFAGKVDAAATWQPYLSQAQTTTGAKLLFSTKSAQSIILDGIVFRQDYVDAHKDDLSKFVEGALEAQKTYTTEFTPIKETMPLFATETNENIVTMGKDAKISDYATNMELLDGTAQTLFEDMSNVWKSLGEDANPGAAKTAFTSDIMSTLSDKFSSTPVDTKPEITEQQRQTAQQVNNTQALLKQSATIEFQPNSAAFVDAASASKVLDNFVKTAKILDGSIIQIEGNIASNTDDQAGVQLSYQRAKSVALYLQQNGVDPSRFVIVGNGGKKPVASNNTEEGKKKNRRTDIFFKAVE